MDPAGSRFDLETITPLPGEPVPVVEHSPGVFRIGSITDFVTLEDIVWAIARREPNGELIIAYRVDHDADNGTVTVTTVNPAGGVHEDESPLLPIGYAEGVMMRLAGS